MIKRKKNPHWEDDSSVFSPAWKDYPPADVDKDPYELYLLKIERDSANNDIVEYFEAYTEYLANRRHDKARKYAKLHEEAIAKRDKLQEKIEKFSKSKNPRCRTFQVKRKVGKKTIQVRRKVCNPDKKLETYDAELVRGPKVPLHLSEKEEINFRKKWYKDHGFKNQQDYYKWLEKFGEKYIKSPDIMYRSLYY